MVYCGKPSKGCSNCRERKIRCDQGEPGCGQCQKRQQECPGYRNLVDLMFRDESSHVIKKAKAKQRNKTVSSSSSDSSDSESCSTLSITPEPRGKNLSILTPSSRTPKSAAVPKWDADDNLLPSPDGGSWPSTPVIALMYSLAPTCQERGTAYFFSRFVTMNDNSCHQKFDFVYDIWKPTILAPERQLDGVMASMTAVGLVGVANLTRSKEIMDGARKSYGTALRLTNAALKHPKEATKDTTMLSVLILGLFEMVTDPSTKSMQGWHEHVNGAAALAKMRGQSQFRTAAGVKMFMSLCHSVIITCIHKGMPMPPAFVKLRNDLSKVAKALRPAIEVTTPIYKALQARYDIKAGRIRDSNDLFKVLDDAEAEFEKVMSNIPEEWQFKVFRMSKPHKAVYGDILHQYPCVWVASIWNGLRNCRILVLETILSELHNRFHQVDPELVSSKYTRKFEQTCAKLEQTMAGVVASVPQHLGLLNPAGSYVDSLLPISTTEVREPPTPQAQSPESTSSFSSGSEYWGLEERVMDHGGPTLMDPTRARSVEEEAERFMLLASSPNDMLWPLFSVGMASICSASMKAYVVERLLATYDETGLAQARTIAGIVKNREVSSSQWMKLPLRLNHERTSSPDKINRVMLPVESEVNG